MKKALVILAILMVLPVFSYSSEEGSKQEPKIQGESQTATRQPVRYSLEEMVEMVKKNPSSLEELIKNLRNDPESLKAYEQVMKSHAPKSSDLARLVGINPRELLKGIPDDRKVKYVGYALGEYYIAVVVLKDKSSYTQVDMEVFGKKTIFETMSLIPKEKTQITVRPLSKSPSVRISPKVAGKEFWIITEPFDN